VTKPSARRQAFERSAHCQFRLQVCITRPWLPVETSCFCALPTPYHDTTSPSAAAALGPTLPLHDSPNHDRSLLDLNRTPCLRPVVIRPLSSASVADTRLPSSTLLPSLASSRPCTCATRKLRRRSGTPTPLPERTSSSLCASQPRARHPSSTSSSFVKPPKPRPVFLCCQASRVLTAAPVSDQFDRRSTTGTTVSRTFLYLAHVKHAGIGPQRKRILLRLRRLP
jgi:hypothetical protein